MSTIAIFLLYPILILVSFVSPLSVRIILLVLSVIIPDPLPFVDEFLFGVSVISKILTGIRIYRVLLVIFKIALGILIFLGIVIVLGSVL